MGKQLKDVNLYGVYCNWISGAEDFKCFFRSTNFVSLKHYPDFELKSIQIEKSSYENELFRLMDRHDVNETLAIIDLPGAHSIAVAFKLQMEKSIKPILVFNGVLHSFGLIGSKEYINELIGYGELLEYRTTKGFAFVLDSQRFGEYSDEQLKKYFNNQYELGEDDLPSADMLKELGFRSVLYIYEDEIKEDLENYLAYLSELGISVCKEDLQGEKDDK